MTERLKKLPKQLLDIWNKYTSKQKALIISVVCVVVFAFGLLAFLINKVDYTELKKCEDLNELSAVVDLLKTEGYKYRFDEKTLTVYIDRKKSPDAIVLLAKNDITADGITLEQLLDNSFDTTNGDRILKANLLFSQNISKKVKEMEGIDDVEVNYIPKDTSNNIFTNDTEDVPASVMLKVNDKFKPQTAETIATVVAATIGNKDAKNIKVADQYGNLLYGGTEDLYSAISIKNSIEYKEKLRETFKNNLYMLLIKRGYEDVEIAPSLEFNMDVVEEMLKEYSAPEGMEQGLYSHSKNFSSKNTNSSGEGVPGTSSNDGTAYEIPDSSASNGSTESSEYDYLPNERAKNIKYETGAVIPEESTVSMVLRDIRTVKQEYLESSGALEGTTYEDYVTENSDLKPLPVDEELIRLVSKATRVPEDNIEISIFEQTIFVPTVKEARSWTDYLQIALVVLIVGLLLFVVFKSVKPVEVTELEPELSVEQLLATTKENQSIEDIEFNEVSEVRRMIEKFVDEKPEAVAQLLRNWLSEDWN